MLSLGFTSSPNDTHIFYAAVHSLIAGAPDFNPVIDDIDSLNCSALEGELDVVKISFHAFGFVRQEYGLLRSGGAMGRSCGPLLVAGKPVEAGALHGGDIAIPGKFTSAALMVQLFDPALKNLRVLPYQQIMPAVQRGDVAAGVIIHESRFTYPDYGLHLVTDIGDWWENTTGCPVPLAGIAVRRRLSRDLLERVEAAVRTSVEHANGDRSASSEYVRQHAPDMTRKLIDAQIGLYVNDYTVDYGVDGERAIREMLRRSGEAGVVPTSEESIFALD